MTLNGWLQILLFFAIICAITKPLGIFIAHVFTRERTFLDPLLRPVVNTVLWATITTNAFLWRLQRDAR